MASHRNGDEGSHPARRPVDERLAMGAIVGDRGGQMRELEESRNIGDADLPQRVLAVATVVPDDDVRLRDGSAELCESYDPRVSTQAREVAAGGSLMDARPGT